MRESTIEKALVREIRVRGGESRKIRWIGRRGAPDRLCAAHGRHCWVELKKPGERPTSLQLREHERMRGWGMAVFVVDTMSDIQKILKYLMI